MNYKEIKALKKSELQELLATTLQQKATLERANASLEYNKSNLIDSEEELFLLDKIDRLELENTIHLREKQEARELAQKYSLSNNELRNELAEGSTPKNVYLHETETIFADSGELHLVSDNLNIVINCSNLVQDLATINDLVIKEAKRELSANITEIKQLTKDI